MNELNDDMDELFRRASENYPLKTNSSDWSKVNIALQAAEAIDATRNDEAKKKNYRMLLWLLLLLLVPFICYRYGPPPNSLVNNSVLKTTISDLAKNDFTKGAPLITITGSKKNKVNGAQEVKASPATIELDSKKGITEDADNANKIIIDSSPMNIELSKNKEIEISGISKETNPTRDNMDNAQILNTPLKDTGQQHKKEEAPITPTGDKTIVAAASDKNNTTNKKEKISVIYAGVLAGIDISTIKFQSVKNAGLNLGILLGYQLNNTIAIESGVIWDKKFYYSKGKYFNTSKIYLPPNSVINDVEGNCAMIEIPINIKYNINTSGKTTWYLLIGASSYFMKTENYYYLLNTAGILSNRNRTYTNSSNNWLSEMNFSLGYSHSFGNRKTSTLRIEPYFKIPLKGVGIGSLPITSSGINIGFTKTIF